MNKPQIKNNTFLTPSQLLATPKQHDLEKNAPTSIYQPLPQSKYL